MTEYALILSAVAVVVFAGYQTMGGSISNVLATIAFMLSPLSVPPGHSG
jgi:Flp pilus assembly pilin Flp